MRTLFLAAAALSVSLPATASDATDVDAVMQAYNKALSPTYCAAQSSVIDDFGQHYWPGPNGCADWAKALAADSKAKGITDGVVTPGKPLRVQVDGDRAYAVYAATYNYKQKGKAVQEKGTWSAVFQKQPAGWRIIAWAWGQLS
ncbi:MAG: nuclear transport factor 2 family protein [Alphaproteobacteria bacterium]|nr:nuclear transport factor 2 family protein [Alphaproteobacteria bacterium]